MKHLLHDDYYLQDGTAEVPEHEVTEANKYPAPTLDQVQDNLDNLINYAMTRIFLDPPLISALSKYQGADILGILDSRLRFINNVFIEARAYEICAYVVKTIAADWLRQRWISYRPEVFLSLTIATANCLPFSEGFTLVTAVLESAPSSFTVKFCAALSPFHSRFTLDWMETHKGIVTHECWGRVAALSHFSWERAKNWLIMGRPLSLRALEAIIACFNYDTLLLIQYEPTLEDAEPNDIIIAHLDKFAASDPVPNVRKKIMRIKELLHERDAKIANSYK